MELWRGAMTAWTNAFGMLPSSLASPLAAAGEPPRTPAAAAASVSRDDEVHRLTRRIDELEARLARLETTRRRRG
jgi:ubiquinone biosynthesis protein UbiJ